MNPDYLQPILFTDPASDFRASCEAVESPSPTDKKCNNNRPLLLTVKELCELLNVSRSTVVRMEREGRLVGRVSVGGSVRYHRETIENWLRNMVKSA